MAGKRASIYDADELDLSGFAPKATADTAAPSPAEVKVVSEAANFPSRQPAQTPARTSRGRTKVHLTGRNRQFNVKATQATIDAFYAIADKQKWMIGVTLERALAALERELVETK